MNILPGFRQSSRANWMVSSNHQPLVPDKIATFWPSYDDESLDFRVEEKSPRLWQQVMPLSNTLKISPMRSMCRAFWGLKLVNPNIRFWWSWPIHLAPSLPNLGDQCGRSDWRTHHAHQELIKHSAWPFLNHLPALCSHRLGWGGWSDPWGRIRNPRTFTGLRNLSRKQPGWRAPLQARRSLQ